MQHYEHLGNFQCSTLGLLSVLTDVTAFLLLLSFTNAPGTYAAARSSENFETTSCKARTRPNYLRMHRAAGTRKATYGAFALS
jgi:hypothetical protein